jgi:hypothetical protein
MMDASEVDIARKVGSGPKRMASTAKHQGAEVDEEGAGDACRSEEDQGLLCASR